MLELDLPSFPRTISVKLPAVTVPKEQKVVLLDSGVIFLALGPASFSFTETVFHTCLEQGCLCSRGPRGRSCCQARQPCPGLQSSTHRSSPSSRPSSLSSTPSDFATVMPNGYFSPPVVPYPCLALLLGLWLVMEEAKGGIHCCYSPGYSLYCQHQVPLPGL